MRIKPVVSTVTLSLVVLPVVAAAQPGPAVTAPPLPAPAPVQVPTVPIMIPAPVPVPPASPNADMMPSSEELIEAMTGEKAGSEDAEKAASGRDFKILRPAASSASGAYTKPTAARSRAGLGPGRPVVVSPESGQIWLISAFAFQVCERKGMDPWNRSACGWTQYFSGDSRVGSGRFMFEIQWPDGKVQRGVRIVEPAGSDVDGEPLVFKRD